MTFKVKEYFNLLKEAGSEFNDDNAIKLAASLSYYTIFSIGPLLLVIITIAGIFFNKQDITGDIFGQIKNMVGKDGAEQLMAIIISVKSQSNKALYGAVGAAILVVGATSIFSEIQGSINYIWSIRTKPKKSWLKFLTDRLLSFSLVVGIGFLLLVSLVINTLMDLLTAKLQHIFNLSHIIFFRVLNIGLLFTIITFMFGVIYKVLPDARIHWKDALVGASFTGVLFIIGKFAIGFYLGSTNMTATYGAAASIIIILSWVYYSSLILYFGAEFTKVYALKFGCGIEAYETSVFILKNEARELPNKKIEPEKVTDQPAVILNKSTKVAKIEEKTEEAEEEKE